MCERKIGIRQMQDGTWAAGVVGWLDVLTDVAYGPTPWEASAAAYATLDEDIPIEWETLPWTTLRIAYGITEGVASITGASLEARDARREAALSLRADAMKRAALAAAAAERRLLAGEVPTRVDVEAACGLARAARDGLPGYGPVMRLLQVALDGGYPERRRVRRLVERAWSALIAANARNDIAPDSR